MLEPAPKPHPDTVDPALRALAEAFESLGGHPFGCEFGIVQRHCGAEPLGLLRWADMSYDALCTALESRFAGVGAPEHTELLVTTPDAGPPEYSTRDRRFMMAMRSFIPAGEVAFDTMLAAACRRLRFLARKLVADLTQADKLFVFRPAGRPLTPAETARLCSAMRAYGDNTLLLMQYTNPSHPAGTVARAAPGLLIGHLEHFAATPGGAITDVPVASWLAVCRAALRLWRTPPATAA